MTSDELAEAIAAAATLARILLPGKGRVMIAHEPSARVDADRWTVEYRAGDQWAARWGPTPEVALILAVDAPAHTPPFPYEGAAAGPAVKPSAVDKRHARYTPPSPDRPNRPSRHRPRRPPPPV